MEQIFISYRRHDTWSAAGLIRDALTQTLEVSVFLDEEKISLGAKISPAIERALPKSRLMLLLIGPRWTSAQGSHLPPIFDEEDWVRWEIQQATQLGLAIIPVYVDLDPWTEKDISRLPKEVQPALQGTRYARWRCDSNQSDLKGLIDRLAKDYRIAQRASGTAQKQAWVLDVEWEGRYLQGLTLNLERLDAALPVANRPESFPLEKVYTQLVLHRLRRTSAEPVVWETVFELDRAAITGDAGAGKSTLLRYIAFRLATRRRELLVQQHSNTQPAIASESATDFLDGSILPVFVDLAKTGELRSKDATSPGNQVEFWLGLIASAVNLPVELSEELLRRGSVLLLIDGLDEVTDSTERDKLIEGLARLQQAYNSPRTRNRVIVACRQAAWKGTGVFGSFEQVVVQPMAATTINTYFQAWCQAIWGEGADAVLANLRNTLRRSPGIAKVAQNPQMAAMLTLFEHNEEVLSQRALLYESFVQRLIRHDDESYLNHLVTLALEMQCAKESDGQRLNWPRRS